MTNLTKQDLIDFELDIASEFENAKIKGPVHLSYNNEEPLIELFTQIDKDDWIFSTWRSHYHALLHGIPKEKVKEQCMQGSSITLCFPEYNLYTSAIVGGIIPIAVGAAMAIKLRNSKEHVWCFIGDMAAETGIAHESMKYAKYHDLPITFVVEDNNFSTSTPSRSTWGKEDDNLDIRENLALNSHSSIYYRYKRDKYPHQGIGKWVMF
jgi:pyruvate dehydrogenase E1 component alpha subunit